jgi:hypothetical protein
MAETDATSGPMAFAASFPPEARFTATAAEIAARLAQAWGCGPDAAEDVRGAVSRAFGDAVAPAAAVGALIDVIFRADGGAFEADLASGGRALLHCSKARSA